MVAQYRFAVERIEIMMNHYVKKLTLIGGFSAIGFILMVLEFSLPVVPSFLKFDISELPALLITFLYGPVSGILVCFIKNLLHLTVTTSAGVGELSNFILGAVLCVSAGLIYRIKKTKAVALLAMIGGSVLMGLTSYLTNTFLIYPFYYHMMPKEAILALCQELVPWISSVEQSIWVFNVPFTMSKGLICSWITFLVYKKLKQLLKLEHS